MEERYKVPAKKNCSPRHGSFAGILQEKNRKAKPTFKKADLQNPYQIRRKEDEQPKEKSGHSIGSPPVVNPSLHLSPRNRHGSCAFNPQSSPQCEVRPSTCTLPVNHYQTNRSKITSISFPPSSPIGIFVSLFFLFLPYPLVSSPVELQTAHPSPRSSPSSPESGSSCPNPLVSLSLVTVGQCQR
ncbi:hypothetical protein GE21DRAFT_1013646 [Neurospora crassa]|nr:hypothetical protein GE21DRAFT_1065872 [Neurospora crassa]KHE81005.1 hypothetical protein GE21DRAFT_1013646 [Neurospora crassa]